MVEQAVDVMMTSEVGDDQTDRRHEQHHSGMIARDNAAHEIPWRPPWSRLVVVDAASVELQGRPRHHHIIIITVETPDEPQCREQTGGAAVNMMEVRPGQSCHSPVLCARATPPGNGSSRRWRIDEGDEVRRNSV